MRRRATWRAHATEATLDAESARLSGLRPCRQTLDAGEQHNETSTGTHWRAPGRRSGIRCSRVPSAAWAAARMRGGAARRVYGVSVILWVLLRSELGD